MNKHRDPERNIEFEFVRATENAALNTLHWVGKGDKEAADEAACDAIRGVFDLVDISGEVVIGEGIKDNAPGIFLGEKLGTWAEGSARFDIALDPVDGTTNVSKGLPNAISVVAASVNHPDQPASMHNLPSYYCYKLAFGQAVSAVVKRLGLNAMLAESPLESTIDLVAQALGKRVAEVTVMVLDRPRNAPYIEIIRRRGASLRMVSDGDISAAIAPSLADSGIDLYLGIGGTPEGIITAAALKSLGGEIQMKMWFRDEAERAALRGSLTDKELDRCYATDDLVYGESSLLAATGISDSTLLPGVKVIGKTVITHSILMRARSRTVRYLKAIHDLEHKTVHLRSRVEEQRI